MNDNNTGKAVAVSELLPPISSNPLVFISHDTRDAELAEAFSKLLKSVSAGMIKTFRSSDKKGGDGIDFGEEWYKRLMTQLQSTSDVVCLFTERSIDRPWILFEAGVAKGKLNTPVVGVALGIPLIRVSAGPFYQFMNMDDSAEDLIKLVNQLAKKVPHLELDSDVVNTQVAAFKTSESEILKRLSSGKVKDKSKDDAEENSVAKLAEEMKSLPLRVAERLIELGDTRHRRRTRRISPMAIDELMHVAGEPGDPIPILMAASMVRDELPWLYELVMEVYRAARNGDTARIDEEIRRIHRFSELMLSGRIGEEFGLEYKDNYIIARELPRILERYLMFAMHEKDSTLRRRRIGETASRDQTPRAADSKNSKPE